MWQKRMNTTTTMMAYDVVWGRGFVSLFAFLSFYFQ